MRAYRTLLTTLLGGSAAALLAAGAIAFAQTTPVAKTTDTLAFCLQMVADVGAAERQAATPNPQVSLLASEGERMCTQGHIQPGITRLRMAWTMLQPTEAAEGQ